MRAAKVERLHAEITRYIGSDGRIEAVCYGKSEPAPQPRYRHRRFTVGSECADSDCGQIVPTYYIVTSGDCFECHLYEWWLALAEWQRAEFPPDRKDDDQPPVHPFTAARLEYAALQATPDEPLDNPDDDPDPQLIAHLVHRAYQAMQAGIKALTGEWIEGLTASELHFLYLEIVHDLSCVGPVYSAYDTWRF